MDACCMMCLWVGLCQAMEPRGAMLNHEAVVHLGKYHEP